MSRLQDLGMEHVGVIVEDLEQAAAYFQTHFGVESFQYYDFAPLRAWSYGKQVEGYQLKIAMGTVNDVTSKIELIQPVAGEGVHRDFLKAGGTGLHHIAYKVDNFDEWKAHYQGRGIPILFEAETEDPVNGYRRCLYVEDPAYHVVIEIKEKAIFR